MEVKKFQAGTIQEAINLVKRDLGSDALILSTRKLTKQKGPSTCTAQAVFEIDAMGGGSVSSAIHSLRARPSDTFDCRLTGAAAGTRGSPTRTGLTVPSHRGFRLPLRARPWGVLPLPVVVLALLIPAHLGGWHDAYVGVPAAIASLVVVTGALVGGPIGGAGSHWRSVSPSTSSSSAVARSSPGSRARRHRRSLCVGIAAGMLGDRYRRQVRASLAERPRRVRRSRDCSR